MFVVVVVGKRLSLWCFSYDADSENISTNASLQEHFDHPTKLYIQPIHTSPEKFSEEGCINLNVCSLFILW